jgi:hypothetical protein
MSETLAEVEGLRVRILVDDDPMMPYNDGGSPILLVDSGHEDYRVTQVTGATSYVLDADLVSLVHEHLTQTDDVHTLVETLAEPFGVTTVETYDTPYPCLYITLDPADWREKVGAPEGSVSLDEWKAYIEGECYGYVVEELVTWVALDSATVPDFARSEERWETVDSCWGFYGIEHVTEEAKRVFEQECAERGIKVTT